MQSRQKDKMLGKIVKIKERQKKRLRKIFVYSLKRAMRLAY
jgi:hypothetical protein